MAGDKDLASILSKLCLLSPCATSFKSIPIEENQIQVSSLGPLEIKKDFIVLVQNTFTNKILAERQQQVDQSLNQ